VRPRYSTCWPRRPLASSLGMRALELELWIDITSEEREGGGNVPLWTLVLFNKYLFTCPPICFPLLHSSLTILRSLPLFTFLVRLWRFCISVPFFIILLLPRSPVQRSLHLLRSLAPEVSIDYTLILSLSITCASSPFQPSCSLMLRLPCKLVCLLD